MKVDEKRIITLTHNNGKTEKFDLLFKEPPRPYIKINELYLRLSDIPYGTININGLYPYIEKIVYCADDRGYLRKLDTHNNKELWENKVGYKINSVILDRDKNIYVGVDKSIKQIDCNKTELCTIRIPNNYIRLNNGIMYIVYKNKMTKFNPETGKEEFSVLLKNNINQVHVDSENNLYLVTNTGIVKLLYYNLQKEWTYQREKIKNVYINEKGNLLVLLPNRIIEINNAGEEINSTDLDNNYDLVVKKVDGTYYTYDKLIKKVDNNGKETWSYNNNYDISSIAIE